MAASRSPAGIPGASTHWLCHAHATHSMDAGASLRLIIAIMGRADPLAPARYQYIRSTPRPRITCRFNSALANEKRYQQLTFREGGASRCPLLHWEPGERLKIESLSDRSGVKEYSSYGMGHHFRNRCCGAGSARCMRERALSGSQGRCALAPSSSREEKTCTGHRKKCSWRWRSPGARAGRYGR